MSKQISTYNKPNYDHFEEYGYYEGKVKSGDITGFLNYLTGQMLTIVDATIVDLDQRKAVKSIVKSRIWSNYERWQQFLFHAGRVERGKCDCKSHPLLNEWSNMTPMA